MSFLILSPKQLPSFNIKIELRVSCATCARLLHKTVSWECDSCWTGKSGEESNIHIPDSMKNDWSCPNWMPELKDIMSAVHEQYANKIKTWRDEE